MKCGALYLRKFELLIQPADLMNRDDEVPLILKERHSVCFAQADFVIANKL